MTRNTGLPLSKREPTPEMDYKVESKCGTNFYSVMDEVLFYLEHNGVETFKVWKGGEDITAIVINILERKRQWSP